MALRYRPSLAQYAKVSGCSSLTNNPVKTEMTENLFKYDSILTNDGLYQAKLEISSVIADVRM